MRQSGYLAAAGLYALKHNVARLEEDHQNASLLAESLANNEHIDVVTPQPDTNIVVFGFRDQNRHNAVDIVAALRKHNVWMNAMSGNRIRAVTHLDARHDDVMRAATVVHYLLR